MPNDLNKWVTETSAAIAMGLFGGGAGAYFSGRASVGGYMMSAIFGAVVAWCINPIIVYEAKKLLDLPPELTINVASLSGLVVGGLAFTLTGTLYRSVVRAIERKVKDRLK